MNKSDYLKQEKLLNVNGVVYVPVQVVPGSLNIQQDPVQQPAQRRFVIYEYQNSVKISKQTLYPVLSLIFLNFFYLLSLEGCRSKPANWYECKDNYFNHLIPWFIEDLLAVLAYLYIAYMTIYDGLNSNWIIGATINIALLIFHSDQFRVNDHNGLNRIFFLFWFFIITGVYIMKLLVTQYRRYILLAILFYGLCLTPFVLWYQQRVSTSVIGWEYGMGGKKIENDGQRCTIPIPEYSELTARRGLLDINSLLPQCSEVNEVVQQEFLPENLRNKPSLKTLGIPRVEFYNNTERYDDKIYMRKVRSQYFDMDDKTVPESVRNSTEFTIDMSSPHRHLMNVKVKRNYTRALEQQAIRAKILADDKKKGKTDRIDKNVFILYIDNFSRANFKRKLPKTVNLLEKYVNNKDEQLELFQFFRYHSVYYNTRFNNNGLWYGQIADIKNISENVFDSYTRNGYITGWFEDGCETLVNTFEDLNQAPLHHWDHLASAGLCDQNFEQDNFGNGQEYNFWTKQYENVGSPSYGTQGRGSYIRHCLYGRNVHDIVFDYAKQFWTAYHDSMRFFRTHLSDAHELLGEEVTYIDDALSEFLAWFINYGYMDNTYFIMIADHGSHNVMIRTPVFPDNSRNIENTHPIHWVMVKKDIPLKNLEALRYNEQSFMCNHDFYSTLKTIAEGTPQRSRYALSYPYISEQLPMNRDCSNTTMFLAWCWCLNDANKAYDQLHSINIWDPVVHLLPPSSENYAKEYPFSS